MTVYDLQITLEKVGGLGRRIGHLVKYPVGFNPDSHRELRGCNFRSDISLLQKKYKYMGVVHDFPSQVEGEIGLVGVGMDSLYGQVRGL